MSLTESINYNRNYFANGSLTVVLTVLFLSTFGHAATPVCGNAIAEAPSEQCDDGNTNSGDGCSSTCIIEPTCGNAIAEPGEECDLGLPVNGTKCSSCQLVIAALCGNGVKDPGEQCDPALNPNSCNKDCTFSACGDGKIGPSEVCDGNGRKPTCNSNCQLSLCFDGNVNPDSGEQCDPGLATAACNWNCRTSLCGDNITNQLAGEQCDPPGNLANGETCSSICLIVGAPTTAPSAGGLDTGAIIGIALAGAGLLAATIPFILGYRTWAKHHNRWPYANQAAAAAAAAAGNPLGAVGANANLAANAALHNGVPVGP